MRGFFAALRMTKFRGEWRRAGNSNGNGDRKGDGNSEIPGLSVRI